MEEIPFSSGDNEEDTSNNFEFFDDDDEEEEETSETTERSLFSKTENESAKDDTEDDDTKRSIFASLIDDEESEGGFSEFVGIAETEDEQVNQEFQEVVEGRLDDVESAIGNAPESEITELTADATFLSNVGERMAEGVPPQEAIEEAMAEDVDIEQPQETVEPVEQNLDKPEEELDPPSQQPTTTSRRSSSSSSTSPPPIPPTLTPTSNTPGGGRGGYGGRGGRGSSSTPTPPSPPSPPTPNAPSPATQGPNTLNPNRTPDSPDISRMNQLYYRDRKRGDLLLGGAIGYLFGRRRGRKKAEARLEPEIAEKEATIDDLKGDLERSEAEVRKAATVTKEKVVAIETPHEEVKEKVAVPPRPEKIPAEPLVEELKEIVAQKETFEKTLAPERDATKDKKFEEATKFEDTIPELSYDVSAEHAKAKQAAQEELQQLKKEHAKEKKRATGTELYNEKKKNVRLMSTVELLEVADNISLDTIPLRKLYETGRIDALGLRRVITEYVHGNNYERVLRSSLESVELRTEKRAELNKNDQRFEKLSTSPPKPASVSLPSRGISKVNLAKEINPTERHITESIERDASLKVSSATAIAIGVLSGIGIVLLAILYSNSL